MSPHSKYVLLFSIFAFLLHQSFGLSKRRRTSSIPLQIHTKRQCFSMRRKENLIQSNRGTHMCYYKGRKYKLMENIFDEHTCRACVCHAPDKVFCCQAELVPDDMPSQCTVDPAGRHSRVHRLGKCMAPLITKGTAGKDVRPCKDRQLIVHLRHSVLFLPPGSFGESRRIWAHINHKSNYRRHAGMREDISFIQGLKEILNRGIYHLPIFDESDSFINKTQVAARSYQ